MRDNGNNKALKASQASARSDEESLVKRAQQGCHLACTELLERHRPLAYRTVYRITRNQDDAEDVLQDASLRAFLKIKHFDGRSRFSTWFVRIAINSALMLLRKRKRWNLISFEKPLETGELWAAELASFADGPEEALLQAERKYLVQQAVKRLPEPLRNITAILQTQNGSLQEVASSAGISLPATKSRLRRARLFLRPKLSCLKTTGSVSPSI